MDDDLSQKKTHLQFLSRVRFSL